MTDGLNEMLGGDTPDPTPNERKTFRNAVVIEGMLAESSLPHEEVAMVFDPERITSIVDSLRELEKLHLDVKGKKENDWKEAMGGCEDSRSIYFTDFNTRPELVPGYQGDGHVKQLKDVPFSPKTPNRELSSDAALTYIQSLIGAGVIVDCPLPHSGIWVRLRPPTDAQLLDLFNSLFVNKIELGRRTSGRIFSNFSVFVNARLAEFIAQHVVSTNFANITKHNLLNHISMLDLHPLILGFAKARFFQGFDYNRPCIGREDPETPCMHITTSKISPENMLWVDNSAIHPSVKEYYFNSNPNAHGEDKWTEVLRHNAFSFSKVVTYRGMEFHLRIPSVREHMNDGIAWINQLVDSVDTAMVESATAEDEDAKKELLATKVHLSTLRQFSHFVGKIVISANGIYIDNRETVSKALAELSGEPRFVSLIVEEIHTLINKAAVAIVGIPEHTCPKCKRNQRGEEEANRWEIIPVNPLYVFFSLTSQRLAELIREDRVNL